MIDSLSQMIDKFLKLDSSKNEIVTPSLMCLSSLCRRFSQIADVGQGSSAVASAGTPMLCSMVACQALLQLSIRCVVHLHDLVSKQPSNEALESGVPRLAASAHLLKGLAEYCTLTSDPPTPHELKSRDLFVVGGGATVLLALSQSNLKTTSRPARVALANFHMNDLELLASTDFQLQNTCQLTTDPLAATLSIVASRALKAEMSKRSKQQYRAQAILRKQADAKEASKRTIEERQEKLEQWLGKRDEEQMESREKWKQRDQKQKAMLAAKLEADKERYAEDKQQRALAAEEYRQKMLLKYQEQKQAAREREAALAEAEDVAKQQKREEAESKVESWLKNKRETMREERGRQLQSHRVAHKKNMKNLRHINAKTFGNTDFSDPEARQIVPGSGYASQSIGGAKLVVRTTREGVGKGGSRKQQHLYGKGKTSAALKPGDSLSLGVMGTSIG
jgi:chemotaxis protein histidine kinase CheA